MKGRNVFAKLILLPCSKVYGAVTYVRNKLFDYKILQEKEFDVPIISVGNIAVGGTGKTPLVEYIVDYFSRTMKVAILSRGYRRDTKGFIIAGKTSMPRDIGDESYQIYHKFHGKVIVAVCEDRVKGISELLRLEPGIELIVLDDAFQHRYVKPTISIVVSEYHRPIYADHMLPYGRLREPRRGINRADVLVVGKCPPNMKPYDFRQVINDYGLQPYQKLFFSHFDYQPIQPVFNDSVSTVPYIDWLNQGDTILAIAGIGNPRPFVKYIKSFQAKVKVDIFPDHHQYTKKDIEYILQRYRQLKGKQRIIITTEKDAVRLAANPYFPHELKPYTFFLPIKVKFNDREDNLEFLPSIEKLIKERTRQKTEQ